jgi:hypothetical protein
MIASIPPHTVVDDALTHLDGIDAVITGTKRLSSLQSLRSHRTRAML